MRRNAVVEAARRRRRQRVALLVRQKLLDRVRLLDVRDLPVPDALPGRIGVAAEHELADGRVHLEELGTVRVAPEGRVDGQAVLDLVPSVDDLSLAAQDLAEDLLERLRGVPADRAPGAALRRRRLLRTAAVDQVLTAAVAVPLDGVDGMDVAVVELQ